VIEQTSTHAGPGANLPRTNFPDRAEGRWDVVLLGDMQYNDDLAQRVSFWIHHLTSKGVDVLFGDPGRSTVSDDVLEVVAEVASYKLPSIMNRSHVNPDDTSVWKNVRKES